MHICKKASSLTRLRVQVLSDYFDRLIVQSEHALGDIGDQRSKRKRFGISLNSSSQSWVCYDVYPGAWNWQSEDWIFRPRQPGPVSWLFGTSGYLDSLYTHPIRLMYLPPCNAIPNK